MTSERFSELLGIFGEFHMRHFYFADDRWSSYWADRPIERYVGNHPEVARAIELEAKGELDVMLLVVDMEKGPLCRDAIVAYQLPPRKDVLCANQRRKELLGS